MKINFDDGSFVDCQRLDDKVIIVIQAKDINNEIKNIINTVEMTVEEFRRLISDTL